MWRYRGKKEKDVRTDVRPCKTLYDFYQKRSSLNKEDILLSEKEIPDKWLVAEGVIKINKIVGIDVTDVYNTATFIGKEVETDKKVYYKDIRLGIKQIVGYTVYPVCVGEDKMIEDDLNFVARIHIFGEDETPEFTGLKDGVLMVEYIKSITWVNKD